MWTLQYKENCPSPSWWPFFSRNRNRNFKFSRDIIKTYYLTKFCEDWTVNVYFLEKSAPTPWRPWKTAHPYTGTIFKISRDIIRINVLNTLHEDSTTLKTALPVFHEDLTINVASRVLTR
ncbi:hypothetical protein DPMN_113995 [Dreissena polymorpha]|uniref:Uncharacterized protein n=1 Tax=Dreissena polymorpha TaxID=45954 RepID=A0A9D4KIF2_DREPO|nr:hypothetical protein DPMN_113995 [Dreissena polymorpha]